MHFRKDKGNDKFEGDNVNEAYPSTPLKFWNEKGSANAGDEFFVVEDEDESKKISDFRKVGKRQLILWPKKINKF